MPNEVGFPFPASTWVARRVAVVAAVAVAAGLAGCGGLMGPLPECLAVSDCPAAVDECHQATCQAGACHLEQLPTGTRVGPQPACQKRTCDAAGTVVVAPDTNICQPTADLTGVSVSVEPDAPIVLHGSYLGGANVLIDGLPVDASSSANGTTLTLVPPGHAAGAVPLSIVTPNGRFDSSLTYVWRRAATRTLVADGSLADWSAAYLAAASPPAIPASPVDVLRALYVAYDRDGLWLGVDGRSSTTQANALLVYIDTGPSSTFVEGSNYLRDLTDNTSALSDACSSGLVVAGARQSMRLCAGSVAMASVGAGDGSPATGQAGVRRLYPVDQFSWLLDASGGSRAVVATSLDPGTVELFLPWATLGLDPYPPSQAWIEVFVRVVDPWGWAISDQSLPPDGASFVVVGALLLVDIRW